MVDRETTLSQNQMTKQKAGLRPPAPDHLSATPLWHLNSFRGPAVIVNVKGRQVTSDGMLNSGQKILANLHLEIKSLGI